MKQYLLVLMVLLTISTSGVNAQGKHRHHQHVTTTTVPADTTHQGIEAFSDTTSVAQTDSSSRQDDSIVYAEQDADDWDSGWIDSRNDILSIVKDDLGGGIWGVVIALFVVALVFLFLLLPFIIVIMVLRHLIRRHNDRATLAQKAMESGQPIPEELKPIDKQTDEQLWKKGVQNAAIGVGLMVMFGIWGAESLVGIGGLILCVGIGKLIISKTSKKQNDDLS